MLLRCVCVGRWLIGKQLIQRLLSSGLIVVLLG
jgi:hypothetical protein